MLGILFSLSYATRRKYFVDCAGCPLVRWVAHVYSYNNNIVFISWQPLLFLLPHVHRTNNYQYNICIAKSVIGKYFLEAL
jgi:hypothetical protein